MGLIPQTKCGRCDRTYSSLRSRCPYCGAHRNKKGKRVSDGDNATWKLIIGILLIVVLVAAVIVILVTSSSDADKDPNDGEGGKTPSGEQEGVDSQPGNNPGTSTVAQITVTAADGTTVSTLTVEAGQAADLTAAVTPETITDKPVWTSSNEAVATVETLDDTGLKIRISGVAAGTATVTATVGETKYEIAVTCSEAGSGTGTVPPTEILATRITAKTRNYNPVEDFTCSKIGQTVEVTAIVTPSNATGVPVWSSSNTDVMEVVPTDETGLKAVVTCVGKGNAKITVTIDGQSYTFIARGPKK